MATIRVKQTFANGDIRFASAWTTSGTPAKEVARINRIAKMRGVQCTYELCTEAEYQAGRAAFDAETERMIAAMKAGE